MHEGSVEYSAELDLIYDSNFGKINTLIHRSEPEPPIRLEITLLWLEDRAFRIGVRDRPGRKFPKVVVQYDLNRKCQMRKILRSESCRSCSSWS